jgi:SOS regulatory protein LexA
MKYIKGKTNPFCIIKSPGSSSGTLADIYRSFYLKNNYCLYDDDRILYVAKNPQLAARAAKTCEYLKGELDGEYMTLFSVKDNKIDFFCIDDLVKSYYSGQARAKYTHFLIDECRCLTREEYGVLWLLRNERIYGETAYIYNGSDKLPEDKFMDKPRRILEINNNNKCKSINFKETFDMPAGLRLQEQEKGQDVKENMMNDNNKAHEEKYLSVERYNFISLKNGKEFKFSRDVTIKDTISLSGDEGAVEINSSEMKELPVFSNIAAGEPILMNPYVEDTFFLPEVWIKGIDNHFLLHVKGDSMTGAGIDDGDYVVIKSSSAAQSRDIVAVDLGGSATLKRLMIKGKSVTLMPENPKYEPIPINDEGAHILGIAVGVLKRDIIKEQ